MLPKSKAGWGTAVVFVLHGFHPKRLMTFQRQRRSVPRWLSVSASKNYSFLASRKKIQFQFQEYLLQNRGGCSRREEEGWVTEACRGQRRRDALLRACSNSQGLATQHTGLSGLCPLPRNRAHICTWDSTAEFQTGGRLQRAASLYSLCHG